MIKVNVLVISSLIIILSCTTSTNRPFIVWCVVTITSMGAFLRRSFIFVRVVLLGCVLNLLVSRSTQVYSDFLLLKSCLAHRVDCSKVPCFFILVVIGVEELVLRLLFLWIEVLLLNSTVIRTDMSYLITLFVL